jgi:hypothetical protein
MEEIGEVNHEDIMRAFFRLKVGDIGRLIKKVGEVTIQAPRTTGRNIIQFLPEANRVVLVHFFLSYTFMKELTEPTLPDCVKIRV